MKTVKYVDWDSVPVMFGVDIAAILTCSTVETVKQWLRTGKLSGGKIGKEWFIDKETFRKEVFENSNNKN